MNPRTHKPVGIECGFPSDYDEDCDRITRESYLQSRIARPDTDWSAVQPEAEHRDDYRDNSTFFAIRSSTRVIACAIANYLRQYICSFFTTIKPVAVEIRMNTSPEIDQIIADRITSLPLRCDPLMFPMTSRCDGLDGSTNSIVFNLSVSGPEPAHAAPASTDLVPFVARPLRSTVSVSDNIMYDIDPDADLSHIDVDVSPHEVDESEMRVVTTDDMVWRAPSDAPLVQRLSRPGNVPSFPTNVTIAYLGFDQAIDMTVFCKRGAGMTHQAFRPTDSVPYVKQAFTVHIENESSWTDDDRYAVAASCPRHVFDIEDAFDESDRDWLDILRGRNRATHRIVVKRPYNCDGCGECTKTVAKRKQSPPRRRIEIELEQHDAMIFDILSPLAISEKSRQRLTSKLAHERLSPDVDNDSDEIERNRGRLMKRSTCVVYNTITGQPYPVHGTPWMIHHIRVQKFVYDQFKSRTVGTIDPFTGGPSRSSQQDKGGRAGLMERDGFLSWGSMRTFSSIFVYSADRWIAAVCRTCKSLQSWNHIKGEGQCRVCENRKDKAHVELVQIPFVMKNLTRMQEFAGRRMDMTPGAEPMEEGSLDVRVIRQKRTKRKRRTK